MNQQQKLILVSGVSTPDFSRTKPYKLDKLSVPLKLRVVLKQLLLIIGLYLTTLVIQGSLHGTFILATVVCFSGYKLIEYISSVNTKDSVKDIRRLSRTLVEASVLGLALGVMLSGWSSIGIYCYGLSFVVFVLIRYGIPKGNVMAIVEDSLITVLPLVGLLWAIRGMSALVDGGVLIINNYLSVVLGLIGFFCIGFLRERLVFRTKTNRTVRVNLSVVSHASALMLLTVAVGQLAQGTFPLFVILEGLLLIVAGILLSERRGGITLRHIL